MQKLDHPDLRRKLVQRVVGEVKVGQGRQVVDAVRQEGDGVVGQVQLLDFGFELLPAGGRRHLGDAVVAEVDEGASLVDSLLEGLDHVVGHVHELQARGFPNVFRQGADSIFGR